MLCLQFWTAALAFCARGVRAGRRVSMASSAHSLRPTTAHIYTYIILNIYVLTTKTVVLNNIRSFVSTFNWPSTFYQYDLDSAVNVLYDALHKSILDHIPSVSFNESTYPTWFTINLKSILFLKKKAYIKYTSSLSINDYREFSLLRAKFKYMKPKDIIATLCLYSPY